MLSPGIRKVARPSSLPNVKEHATLSAGASVDHGVDVKTTGEHLNRAADRGCCVSACWASCFGGSGAYQSVQRPRRTKRAIRAAPSNGSRNSRPNQGPMNHPAMIPARTASSAHQWPNGSAKWNPANPRIIGPNSLNSSKIFIGASW